MGSSAREGFGGLGRGVGFGGRRWVVEGGWVVVHCGLGGIDSCERSGSCVCVCGGGQRENVMLFAEICTERNKTVEKIRFSLFFDIYPNPL